MLGIGARISERIILPVHISHLGAAQALSAGSVNISIAQALH